MNYRLERDWLNSVRSERSEIEFFWENQIINLQFDDGENGGGGDDDNDKMEYTSQWRLLSHKFRKLIIRWKSN